uniref:40kDa protein n=1 Tax=Garlic virus B TaxID=12432 RepID=Q67696_9VIRU|nr:40kDa protein [Garlic virus B]
MTYATVWQLFEVRDHIINHINTFKNQLAGALQNAQATLIESNHLTLDNKLKPIKEILDTFTSTVPTKASESTSQTQDQISLREAADREQTPTDRTFFTNLNAALTATGNLLTHVPPARYNLPATSLPLDELYGLLHALHKNSLEWLTHLSHDADQIINKLNTVENGVLNEARSDSRRLDLILQRISEVESKINDQATPTLDHHLLKTLTSIETRLQELHAKLIATPTDNPAGPSSSMTKPSGADTHSDHSVLPIFEAKHPTARCRSYGHVEFNGLSLHIPMDVQGRRPSTALRLITKHTLSSDATTVKYELLDDGALLLTEEIKPLYKLNHPLSDSLALLHSKCPNFIYKIRDDGLC